MTRDERIRAFSMRCDGKSWEQIAAALHRDPRGVARDLQSVLQRPTRHPTIRYPAIRDHVEMNHSGSVEAFAHSMGVSPYRLRRVIIHGDTPSPALKDKLIRATGLTREEIFQCLEQPKV